MHNTRTAKVVEIIGTSPNNFDEAIRNALSDARETTRHIEGCHVNNWSIKCDNGEIREYRVDLKLAFGIERTST